MPFANCKQCGRLFHFLDPTQAGEASDNWPTDRDTYCPECRQMSRDNEHNPDPNENAARIVSESTTADALPADVEAAWEQWSAGIQNVDERGMTLLKVAFEAGFDAASHSS